MEDIITVPFFVKEVKNYEILCHILKEHGMKTDSVSKKAFLRQIANGADTKTLLLCLELTNNSRILNRIRLVEKLNGVSLNDIREKCRDMIGNDKETGERKELPGNLEGIDLIMTLRLEDDFLKEDD